MSRAYDRAWWLGHARHLVALAHEYLISGCRVLAVIELDAAGDIRRTIDARSKP